MGFADVENLEKYRSYIQRRRVLDTSEGHTQTHALVERKEEPQKAESFFTEDADRLISQKTRAQEDADSARPNEEASDCFGNYTSFERSEDRSWTGNSAYDRTSAAHGLRRVDSGLYKRLYGNRRNSYTSSLREYRSGSASGYTTEIADNHTTVMAIRIIKQSLACFAILGIVVLMQQQESMADALSFVKKHVVDTHWDPQGLLAGVENIIKACSRFLGGSP